MSVRRKYLFSISIDFGDGRLLAYKAITGWDREEVLQEVEEAKKEMFQTYKGLEASQIYVQESFFNFREDRADLKGAL